MIHMSQIKVPVERVCQVAPAELVKHGIIGTEEKALVAEGIAKVLRVPVKEIRKLTILRKSVDARKKHQIQMIYQVQFQASREQQLIKRYGKNDAKIIPDAGAFQEDNPFEKKETSSPKSIQRELVSKEKLQVGKSPKTSPVVVGMGPAGLFAALELSRAGLCPILLERGTDVDKRREIVSEFWNTGELDSQTNVQFGEGGAGTFSDGKLNTMVKDPTGRNRQVLQTFVDFGAPSEILYLQKPHIGTDKLGAVVKAIREEIIRLGGQVYFETRLEKVRWNQEGVQEIVVSEKGVCREIPCDTLVLATGHSARDTVTELYRSGLAMEPKAFAIGVRVEHSQEMIGTNQYGDYYRKLPTADYKLTYTTGRGRGVYSFCMCPGGYVVNASSEPGRLVVNGMSDYARDSRNANSAIVVTVDPSDFQASDALAGIAFQRKWEEAAFREGKGKIPVQLLADFWQKKVSTGFGTVKPCMKGGHTFGNVRSALPEFVGDAIAEGMSAFDKKIAGYAGEDTVISGIESRTSSPVRICRNQTLQANVPGIYPCGEGAGYAGGITSAAMDGIRVAQEILRNC